MTSYYIVTGVIVAGLLQAYLLARLVRGLQAMTRTEERVTRFGEALALLTETCEAGFVAMGREMARSTDRPVRSPRARSTTRRVTEAARRGDSLQQIASTERLSEGEVRLRLLLADAAPPREGAR